MFKATKTYALNIWDILNSSYWFIPSLLAFLSIIFSIILTSIDLHLDQNQLPEWIITTTESARASLSTITGAMIAVTGTVFSITIVTLSLTSQQFGPRLLRTFMLDTVTQVTLGVFLSTALYCVLITRVIEKHSEGLDINTPHIAVTFGVVLMVVSIAMLIFFIHHIAVLIQAPRIVQNVGIELNSAIDRLFPETIGARIKNSEENSKENIIAKLKKNSTKTIQVESKKEGYLQALSADILLDLAQEQDIVIEYKCRPGDFIIEGSKIACVYGDSDSKILSDYINESIIVGMRRTPRQDLECAILELVEVAVRSLSPGINDPFTAMSCIDRLAASMCRLVRRSAPSPVRCDRNNNARLLLDTTEFPAILNSAFQLIRQHARSSVGIMICLLEALVKIAEFAKRDSDKKAIMTHGTMIFNMAGAIDEKSDYDDIERRFYKLKNKLGVA